MSQEDWELFKIYDVEEDTLRMPPVLRYVELADLDNDGNIDILAVYSGDILWFKNEGNLEFGEPEVIFGSRASSKNPYLDIGDIDGDGDLDIVYDTAESDDRILWLENIDNGSSFEEHLITNMFFSNHCELKDLDSDGDLDILTAGTRHTEWYRNTDGKGNFEFERQFYDYFNGSRHVITAEDFNSDGYLDILYWRANGGSFGTDDLYVHYGLDGNGNFGDQVLLSSDDPHEIIDIEIIDINGDQEKDVVICHGKAGTRFVGEIIWRRVSNGQIRQSGGSLSEIKGLTYLEKIDIDKDGDLDIITSAGKFDDPISSGLFLIFLNNGNGQFENTLSVVTDEGRVDNVKAADLNNDGTIEMVGVTTQAIYLVDPYFSTTTSTDINVDENLLIASPNPVVNELTLQLPQSTPKYRISIFDLNGVLLHYSENQTKIKMSHLPAGVYILNAKSANSKKTYVKTIVKI
ncbi:MAG: T9SS type A sorting domain-containing protein [Bacteroidetes bacterium]|jgi:hypothetical protein|nr:T9SS type A sorting domain-containing protein [Bacteroidota bacterium]